MNGPDRPKDIRDLGPNVWWKILASKRSTATTEGPAHRTAGEASSTCTKADEASTPWLVTNATTYTVRRGPGAIWSRPAPRGEIICDFQSVPAGRIGDCPFVCAINNILSSILCLW